MEPAPDIAYTKAGILLDDLITADLRPRTLFEGDTDKRDWLMGALDEINTRFGKFSATTASQGFKREWKNAIRDEIAGLDNRHP